MLPIFDFLNVKQILLIQELTGFFPKISRIPVCYIALTRVSSGKNFHR